MTLAQQLFSAVARNVSAGSKILTGLLNLLEQAEARESTDSKLVWRAGFLEVVGEEIRRGGTVSTDLVRALLRQPVSADIDACLMKLVEQPGRAALPANLLLHAYSSSMGRLAVAPEDNRTAPNLIPFAPQLFEQGSISGDLKKFIEATRQLWDFLSYLRGFLKVYPPNIPNSLKSVKR